MKPNIARILCSYFGLAIFLSSGGRIAADDDKTSTTADAVMQPYGVVTHWNEAKYFALAKAAGVQWLRIDISWYHVEPEQGVWNWEAVDAALQEAKRLNLHVLAVIGYTPAWAASGDTAESRYHAALEKYDKDFQNYVAQVTQRYANLVDVWEVWNEPDGNTFLQVGPGSWAAEHHPAGSNLERRRFQYIHNMELALGVMRPLNLQITTSGFALGGHCDADFVDWLLKRGSWMNQFPIFNFHMYGYPSHTPLVEAISRVKAWQKQMPFEAPLWITEHGITSLDVPGAEVRSYLVKSYALALSDGVKKIFWFRLMPGGRHMTLLDEGGTAAAAYAGYRALTTHWGNILSVRPWESNKLGVQGAIAERLDGRKVAILWSKDPAPVSSIPLEVENAYDNAGGGIPIDGLKIGGHPIYLHVADPH